MIQQYVDTEKGATRGLFFFSFFCLLFELRARFKEDKKRIQFRFLNWIEVNLILFGQKNETAKKAFSLWGEGNSIQSN